MLAGLCGSLAAWPVLVAELREPGVALPPVRVDHRADSGGGEQRLSLVTGANLQPGLYKLRLWTVCSTATPRAARITVDLLLKSPSDLNLRGFRSDELLHQR